MELRKRTSSTKLQSQRRLRVFLCHASSDKPAIRKLYRWLQSKGVEPWLDEEQLLPGQNWQHEISRAVRGADVVIVGLSRRSMTEAGYVHKEIKYALDVADLQPEGTIFIIPAKLEECEVPDRLSHIHWVNLFEKSGYPLLFRTLEKIAARLEVSGIQPGSLSLEETLSSSQDLTTPVVEPIRQAESIRSGQYIPDRKIPSSGQRSGLSLNDHPVVVAIMVMAALVAIIAFITGRTTLSALFDYNTLSQTPNQSLASPTLTATSTTQVTSTSTTSSSGLITTTASTQATDVSTSIPVGYIPLTENVDARWAPGGSSLVVPQGTLYKFSGERIDNSCRITVLPDQSGNMAQPWVNCQDINEPLPTPKQVAQVEVTQRPLPTPTKQRPTITPLRTKQAQEVVRPTSTPPMVSPISPSATLPPTITSTQAPTQTPPPPTQTPVPPVARTSSFDGVWEGTTNQEVCYPFSNVPCSTYMEVENGVIRRINISYWMKIDNSCPGNGASNDYLRGDPISINDSSFSYVFPSIPDYSFEIKGVFSRNDFVSGTFVVVDTRSDTPCPGRITGTWNAEKK